MGSYLLFVVIAIATVLSPGPGVMLTLTNAIRFGVSGAFGGILGIAFGTFIVAGISATSLGIVLATSATAFSIMKFIGAAYLIYLGVKLWRSPVTEMEEATAAARSRKLQFLEGLTLQLTNPKAVFFFLSVFPQFIDYSTEFVGQFALLVVTYSALVVAIHLLYARLARSARGWLSSEKGGHLVNKLGGATFVGFGVGLATASR
ncbi:LysE family translocator [Marinobacter salarius]|jgi:threonine/homoserine/homoserine lactone efflux protein|uniref:Threonine/homoserine/homoserine lactone efflux protein n=1 Tax=Marinobacter salarius TaxID=1420917 RepID=A0ABY1FLE7_9GAMM|nr:MULTISPECIES: LysE family translocator [Marinobacter]KXJ48797.1 MAG: lysine transporter LysE [Marinobacter sp. Hex_13]MBS8229656.1 LysE family translocator [Marinobacter salarius]MCC4284708.1 LysE family translocator [Marinobacter salarius]MDP4533002.1 LysE family translocator [Marinobacter salarius]SFL56608.1 Threonine/homoserine/homoserine lactone efflux protein [Marinobacter salarius]|tara:strand:- start:263 stop:874 length:612 start_codon:yes stop_codon:yes gene_type:complete